MTLAAIGAKALTAAVRLLRGTTIWPFLLGIVVGLALPGSLGAAQQFSADLVGKSAGKIYVSNSKVRIETSDFPGGLFLLDGDAHIAYFVKPAQRVLMDAKQSSWLTQILVPVDPDHPCKQWQAMAEIAGAAHQGNQWRCNRLSPESAGGREPIKYQAISPEGLASHCLIDPARICGKHRPRGWRQDRSCECPARASLSRFIRNPRQFPQIRSASADRPHQAKRRLGRAA